MFRGVVHVGLQEATRHVVATASPSNEGVPTVGQVVDLDPPPFDISRADLDHIDQKAGRGVEDVDVDVLNVSRDAVDILVVVGVAKGEAALRAIVETLADAADK